MYAYEMTSITYDRVRTRYIDGPVTVNGSITALDDAIFRDVYLVPTTGTDSMYITPVVAGTLQLAIGCVDTVTGIANDSFIIRCRDIGSNTPALNIPDFLAQSVGTAIDGVLAYDSNNDVRPLTILELQSLIGGATPPCTAIQPLTVSYVASTQGLVCPVQPPLVFLPSDDVANTVAISRVSNISQSNSGASLNMGILANDLSGNLMLTIDPSFITSTTSNPIYTFNTSNNHTYEIDIKVALRNIGNLNVSINVQSAPTPGIYNGTLIVDNTGEALHYGFLVHNIGNVLSVIPIEEHSGSTYTVSSAVSNINAIILPSGTSVSAVDVINSGLSLMQPSISYTILANTVSFTVDGVSLGYNIDAQINIVRVG